MKKLLGLLLLLAAYLGSFARQSPKNDVILKANGEEMATHFSTPSKNRIF